MTNEREEFHAVLEKVNDELRVWVHVGSIEYRLAESVWKHTCAALAAPTHEPCGACGDGCKDRGSCRVEDESPKAAPVQQEPVTGRLQALVERIADFCFGKDSDCRGVITLGAARLSVLHCLSAKDGIDIPANLLTMPQSDHAEALADAGLLTEVGLISDAYNRVRAERTFAADDLEYDLFAAGWKECAKLSSKKGGA